MKLRRAPKGDGLASGDPPPLITNAVEPPGASGPGRSYGSIFPARRREKRPSVRSASAQPAFVRELDDRRNCERSKESPVFGCSCLSIAASPVRRRRGLLPTATAKEVRNPKLEIPCRRPSRPGNRSGRPTRPRAAATALCRPAPERLDASEAPTAAVTAPRCAFPLSAFRLLLRKHLNAIHLSAYPPAAP